MPTTRKLCITPRAATLTIVADPALEDAHRVTSNGPAPRIRDRGDAVEVDYTIAGRLRAATTRSGSRTLALNPAVAWAIELHGGVSGLRADLRRLRVRVAIAGGARDVVVDLPEPSGELALRVEGGLSRALVRRPAAIPVDVQIDGGARHLRLDDAHLGSIGGAVRQQTGGDASGGDRIGLHVLGGASGLTVAPYERRTDRVAVAGAR